MSRHGSTAIVTISVALGVWLVWKLWQKYRFEQLAAISHITPVELTQALESETPPLLLDFRGAALIAQEGPIARATPARLEDLPQVVSPWPKDHRVVTLCACPQDATAVRAARVLMKLGYTSVRPLKGGYDAWMKQLGEHGHGSR